MKTFQLFSLAFALLLISCTKNENPDPENPKNEYRIKEILRQEGGKDFSKTIFTYEGEKLVKKQLIPLQPIEDLAYTEIFSYDGKTVTRVEEGMVKAKTVTEFDGTKIVSETHFIGENGTFILSKKDRYNYEEEKLLSIEITIYSDSDSTKSYIDFLYSDDKLMENVTWVHDENGIKEILSKRQYEYMNEKVALIKYFQKDDSDLGLQWKVEYKYSGDDVVSKYNYRMRYDGEFVIFGAYYYDYNEYGYLEKENYNYTETYYTYEEGIGNASNVMGDFIMHEFYPTPNYKSGSLYQGIK